MLLLLGVLQKFSALCQICFHFFVLVLNLKNKSFTHVKVCLVLACGVIYCRYMLRSTVDGSSAKITCSPAHSLSVVWTFTSSSSLLSVSLLSTSSCAKSSFSCSNLMLSSSSRLFSLWEKNKTLLYIIVTFNETVTRLIVNVKKVNFQLSNFSLQYNHYH